MNHITGKVHWSIGLFVVALAVFIAMMLAPVIGELRKPPQERVSDQFLRALIVGEYEDAKKLTDFQHLPKERQDFIQAWKDRLNMWGEVEGTERIDAVPAPKELKHSEASKGWRVEYHIKGYLTVGYVSIYVVPVGNDWKVVDYEFR